MENERKDAVKTYHTNKRKTEVLIASKMEEQREVLSQRATLKRIKKQSRMTLGGTVANTNATGMTTLGIEETIIQDHNLTKNGTALKGDANIMSGESTSNGISEV